VVTKACAWCGSIESIWRATNRDYISGQGFGLLECAGCGLLRTNFQADSASLGQYYDAAYYGQGGRRFPAPMEAAIRWFREERVRAILAQQPAPGRILDIGCGRGLMLAALQRRGWEVVGTEFAAPLAQAVAAEHGFPVYADADLSNLALPAQQFDVITLWHVLEHLPDPLATLQEVRRLLKVGGLLVIEVPNLESWQAQVGGGRWFHLDCPRHLYHFGAQDLSLRLSALGFERIQQQTISLEYGPYGMLQSLLNRLTYQPNVLYARLKRSRPTAPELTPWQRRYDDLITLLGLPLVGLLSFGLEGMASAFGRGGIVRVVARRGPGEPSALE
jgi:SAM-dependent methyltransferase